MPPQTSSSKNPSVGAEASNVAAATQDTSEDYDYDRMRAEAKKGRFICGIHGNVYDLTNFIDKHPGGGIIRTALGRDATVLFETHHNLLDMDKIKPIMEKYRVGKQKDYVAVARFDTPFAKTMLQRCKEALKGVDHRESWYGTSAVLTVYALIAFFVFASFRWGSFLLTPFFGLVLGLGHLAGHAGNHWSLSNNDYVSRFISVTCTNLWGLYEKNWEFSHVISHHCYNYTERDYVMDQHVPRSFYRTRPCDPWKPIHAYQHYFFRISHIVSFLVGGLRVDCAPFIFISPLLRSLRRNENSPLPAPQFFAAGSNVAYEQLKKEEDGVGPEKFYIFYESMDHLYSLLLANLIWLPLFLYQWRRFGFWHATLYNFCVFGFQASFVTRSLFTQHICEDIQLQQNYAPTDDWYALQVSSSTSIMKPPFNLWLTLVICYQIEHHMFPCANPKVLAIVQPIVRQTAKEFGIQYNEFKTEPEALESVYKHFKQLSVKPEDKKE